MDARDRIEHRLDALEQAQQRLAARSDLVDLQKRVQLADQQARAREEGLRSAVQELAARLAGLQQQVQSLEKWLDQG
jgi:hypothetical protein